jgi:anti-sigma B factor antagonist
VPRASSPFNAHVTRGGQASTVRVAGEIDAATAPELAAAIEHGSADGRTVLLDLDETTFIDSAGLRIIMRAAQSLELTGSYLQLIAASPAAVQILHLTGIYDALKDPGR